MKKSNMLAFFIVLTCFFSPNNVMAAVCWNCYHSQPKTPPYKCEKCGKTVFASPYIGHRPPLSGTLPPSLTKKNVPGHIFDGMKNTRGKGKAVAAGAVIVVGVLLFFYENPVLGTLVIIIGLLVAYQYFKENSSAKPCSKKTKHKTSTVSAESTEHHMCFMKSDSVDTSTEYLESVKKTTEASSRRPTRISDTIIAETKSIETLSLRPERVSDTTAKKDINTDIQDGKYWYNEGVLFCNGNDGREIDYKKALKCFKKAKDFGIQHLDDTIKYLESLQQSFEKK